MLHQPHGPRGVAVVGLPQALGLQARLLVLVGPVGRLAHRRAGRARVDALFAEVCVGATGFYVFRGDGVAAAWSREDGVARTTGYDNTCQETLRDAPSGWTCSSSALRFRVGTAGPVSSLTMVPRSPAGGFVVTSRGVCVGGFPQPFCNERSVLRVVCMVEQLCVFSFGCTLGLRFLQPRASYRDNVAGCQALAGA